MLRSRLSWLLLLPVGLLLALTLVGPLLVTLVYSLGERAAVGGYVPALSLANYTQIGTRSSAFVSTFTLSVIATVLCTVIALPVAFVIAKQIPRRYRYLAVFLAILPFLTSFVARTYAWYFLLGSRGIPQILRDLGFGPIRLLNTDFAVLVGVVYAYIPILILTLFVAIERIDDNLLEASYDLGRSKRETFFSVVLPLTVRGIVVGSSLIFLLLAGEFLIPSLLGGGKVLFVGNAIVDLFLKSRNWPLGAAVAVALVVLMLLTVGLFRYLARPLARRFREVEGGS